MFLALAGCGGNSSGTSPNTPISKQPLTQMPNLLVWNANSDGSSAALYAYTADQKGSLQLAPGFPIPQPLISQADLDTGSNLLFVSDGPVAASPNTINAYSLYATGPQLVSSGSVSLGSYETFTLWPSSHALLVSYGMDSLFGPDYIEPFTYDTSGKLTSGQTLQGPGSIMMSQTALPSSILLGVGSFGHTCTGTDYVGWSIGANGELAQQFSGNASLPDPAAVLCSEGFSSSPAFTASGDVFLVAYSAEDSSGNPVNDLHSARLNKDGSLQPIGIAQTGNANAGNIVIDEKDNLAFVVLTDFNPLLERTLTWYSFDPKTGTISPQPIGQRTDISPLSLDMVGGFLVVGQSSGFSLYSVSFTGLTMVSTQSLPLPLTVAQAVK
jgi:hypothetical protein